MRTCARCRAPAVRVAHVIQHYNRGLPMGKSYQHRCEACGVQFETLSGWKSLTDGFFALLVMVGGLVILGGGLPAIYYAVSSPIPVAALGGLGWGTWGAVGGGSLVLLLGMVWLVSVGWQNAALFRNPPV